MTTINAKEEGVVFFFLGQTTCPSSAQSNQKEMNRGGEKDIHFSPPVWITFPEA